MSFLPTRRTPVKCSHSSQLWQVLLALMEWEIYSSSSSFPSFIHFYGFKVMCIHYDCMPVKEPFITMKKCQIHSSFEHCSLGEVGGKIDLHFHCVAVTMVDRDQGISSGSVLMVMKSGRVTLAPLKVTGFGHTKRCGYLQLTKSLSFDITFMIKLAQYDLHEVRKTWNANSSWSRIKSTHVNSQQSVLCHYRHCHFAMEMTLYLAPLYGELLPKPQTKFRFRAQFWCATNFWAHVIEKKRCKLHLSK